jgi:hypothetical protein
VAQSFALFAKAGAVPTIQMKPHPSAMNAKRVGHPAGLCIDRNAWEFIVLRADAESFDSASSSLRDADAPLRMTGQVASYVKDWHFSSNNLR